MALFSGSTKTQVERNPMRRDLTTDWQNRFFALSRVPREFFPSQTYASLDPLQQEALQMREQYGRGMSAMVDPAMDAWRSTLSAPDVANNPYVQGMLEQQANIASRDLREAIPGIESAAIGAGQFGGSRQGVVEAMRERGIREALAQSAAQTQLGAYGQGLAQQRYGLSAAPGMAQFGMMPADVLSGVGGFRRAEEQKAINEAMARHDFAQNEEFERLQRFVAPYQAMSAPYGETTTKESYSPSALQIAGQLAGLGLSGLGAYQAFNNPFGGGAFGTPAMSPYTAPGGLNPWLSDMMAYQRYRNP